FSCKCCIYLTWVTNFFITSLYHISSGNTYNVCHEIIKTHIYSAPLFKTSVYTCTILPSKDAKFNCNNFYPFFIFVWSPHSFLLEFLLPWLRIYHRLTHLIHDGLGTRIS